MAAPDINTTWNVSNNGNRVEPSAGVKNVGIQDGDTIAREWLNWQFWANGQFNEWARTRAMDAEDNLIELRDKAESRNNLGVYGKDEVYIKSQVYSRTESDDRYLNESNNLSDLDDTATARDNLDVYSKTQVDNSFLSVSSNLSDLSDATAARTNLDVLQFGSGDDQILNNLQLELRNDARYLRSSQNLGDISDAAAARVSLGIYNLEVSASGTVTLQNTPTTWTATRTATGDFTVTHNLGTTDYTVVATSIRDSGQGQIIHIREKNTNNFLYHIDDAAGTPQDNVAMIHVTLG